MSGRLFVTGGQVVRPDGVRRATLVVEDGRILDADYRGEVMVAVHNHGRETRVIEPGERIAQLVIAPVIRAGFDEGELDDTARGAGGFGSTGTK